MSKRSSRRRRNEPEPYLSGYGLNPTAQHHGPPNPYTAVRFAAPEKTRGWRSRKRNRRGDPAASGRSTREHRRAEAGWPSATGASTAATGRRAGRQEPAMPPGEERPRTGRKILGVLTAAVVAPIVLVIVLSVALSQDDPPSAGSPTRSNPVPTASHPNLDEIWEVAARDHLDEAEGIPSFGLIDSLDPYASPRPNIVIAPGTWVAALDNQTDRMLIAIDPQDGSVRWSAELDGVQCATELDAQGNLVCLSGESEDWSVLVLDPVTGEQLASTPTTLTSPWGVHLTDAGLLAMAESTPRTHDRLTLIDVADGTEVWAEDLLALDDAEYLFTERTRDQSPHTVLGRASWDALSDRTLLRASIVALYIDLGSGPDRLEICYPSTLSTAGLACAQYPGTTMFDDDGGQLWNSAAVELARTSYWGEEVLGNNDEVHLWETDWSTGIVGERLADSDEPALMSGSEEYPFFISGEQVFRLDAEQRSVLWQADVADLDEITTVLLVDDIAVVTGLLSHGLDLETGDERWVRSGAGMLDIVDGELTDVGFTRLRVYEMP